MTMLEKHGKVLFDNRVRQFNLTKASERKRYQGDYQLPLSSLASPHFVD